MNRIRFLKLILGVSVLVLLTPAGQAQWVTQSVVVKPGWTALYLNVAATYQSLDQLVGSDPANPITEVWLWKAPASTVQFLTTPANPLTSGSDWAHWSRPGAGPDGTLSALIPNAAASSKESAASNTASRRPVVEVSGRVFMATVCGSEGMFMAGFSLTAGWAEGD